jgi:hypothetical protein
MDDDVVEGQDAAGRSLTRAASKKRSSASNSPARIGVQAGLEGIRVGTSARKPRRPRLIPSRGTPELARARAAPSRVPSPPTVMTRSQTLAHGGGLTVPEVRPHSAVRVAGQGVEPDLRARRWRRHPARCCDGTERVFGGLALLGDDANGGERAGYGDEGGFHGGDDRRKARGRKQRWSP